MSPSPSAAGGLLLGAVGAGLLAVLPALQVSCDTASRAPQGTARGTPLP